MEVNQVQEQPQQQPWTGYLATRQHVPHPGQGSQHSGLPAHQLPTVSGGTTASSSSFRSPSAVRRIFHIGPPSPSSSPSSSTRRTDSIRMVKIEEVDDEYIENEYVNLTETVNDASGEWVILDSGYTTGYTYSHAKTPALPPVLPQLVDKDAADVAAYKGGNSEEEELQPELPEQSVPSGAQEPGGEIQEQEIPVAAMEMTTSPSGPRQWHYYNQAHLCFT